MDFSTGEHSTDMISLLWPYHAALMVTGFIIMSAGAYLSRYKPGKYWFNGHKWAGITGSMLSLAGFVLAFYMVSGSTGTNFRYLHSYVGVVSTGIILATLSLGLYRLKVRDRELMEKVNTVHRWSGRVTLVP